MINLNFIQPGDHIWEISNNNNNNLCPKIIKQYPSCRIYSCKTLSNFYPQSLTVDTIISPSQYCEELLPLAQKYLAATIVIHTIQDQDFIHIRNVYANSKSKYIIESYHSISTPEKSFIIARVPDPKTELNFLDLSKACLEDKLKNISSTFSKLLPKKRKLEIIRSPSFASRLRVRFGLQRSEKNGELTYFVYDTKKVTKNITNFPIAATPIQRMMPLLIKELIKDDSNNNGPKILSNGIRAVHFRATLMGDMLITLIYDQPIEDEISWQNAALNMKLGEWVNIMGRSKGQVVSTRSKRFVEEKLKTKYGQELYYRQPEGSFSNPNGRINEKCLDWLCDVVSKDILCGYTESENNECNLLELFCGSGNHTMALASYFHSIIAVELDQHLVSAAKYNAKQNQVDNVSFIRLHSQKFCRKVLSKKQYNGTTFHAVLVDPPRCGLDEVTLQCCSKYDHVLYISCNPIPLLRDLTVLSETHEVCRFSVMDQFSGTSHLECGVYCKRRK